MSELVKALPPFSRALCVAALSTTVPVVFGLLPFGQVVFNAHLIKARYEAWRLLSTFLYVGAARPWAGGGWLALLYLYLLGQVIVTLEEDFYPTRPADLCWQALLAGSAIIAVNIPLHTILHFPALLVAFSTVLAAVSARRHISFIQGFLTIPTHWLGPMLIVLQVAAAGSAYAALPGLSGLVIGYLWALLIQRKSPVLAAPIHVQFLFPEQPDKPRFYAKPDKTAPPRFGMRTYNDINTAAHARPGSRITRTNFRDMPACASCG
ncbi:hypothetical protein AURDEDRAFT_160113 [Auricularia subglabra TFB-10046 SS5]|nr:hypothetical protein AURDEDRAFT_160113 [Auricularia subglabra TFB-10046 SS5]